MQTAELTRIIEQVGKDKGISQEVLVGVLEEALEAAAKRKYGDEKEIEAQFNLDTAELELFEFLEVVDKVDDPEMEIEIDEAQALDPDVELGDSLGMKMEISDFGRIAAQTAKQVIIQKVRDAERENNFQEYKDRRGELITGIVRRFEKGSIIVDLGKADAILPPREQVHTESYRQGDRIQSYILDVARNSRAPQVILSRTHPNLLIKLFQMEVPEIYEGIVEIKAAVREPGQRAKIAVASRDADVDPVGACVGMKGSRVQAVVQELRGEKIDIIPYSIDSARFVCSAIAPAAVTKVIIDEENHTMELVVPDDQLSLAIGRRGQNVRLAAQLTGWKIDIHSETRIQEMNEQARVDLERLNLLNEVQMEILIRYGFRNLTDVADAEPDDLEDTLGIDPEKAQSVIDEADAILTVELRAELARNEENEKRIAAGLPTLEEEEEAKRLQEEAEEAQRRAELGLDTEDGEETLDGGDDAPPAEEPAAPESEEPAAPESEEPAAPEADEPVTTETEEA